MDENDIGTLIVDRGQSSFHQDPGPGLLETVYEVTLAHKLQARYIIVERQVAVAISYHSFSVSLCLCEKNDRTGQSTRRHRRRLPLTLSVISL